MNNWVKRLAAGVILPGVLLLGACSNAGGSTTTSKMKAPQQRESRKEQSKQESEIVKHTHKGRGWKNSKNWLKKKWRENESPKLL